MSSTLTVTRPRRKAINYIRNWSAYDRALVQRGSLTIWISEEALVTWGYQGPRQRGAQFEYSVQAIEAVLTLKEVFHVSNRQAEGLVRSAFALLHVALAVPDHSTLSRRGCTVQIQLPKRARGPLHVVMDSSGLKGSGEVQAAMLSTTGVSDAEMVEPMPSQIDAPLARIGADDARAPDAAIVIPRSRLVWGT